MRAIITIIVGAIVAGCVWRVASVISADAISMAIGFLFGALSSIPVTLIALSGNHSRRPYTEDELEAREQRQAPVVVLYSNRQYNQHVYLAGDEDEEVYDLTPTLRHNAITTRK